jgi:hypothetical protein
MHRLLRLLGLNLDDPLVIYEVKRLPSLSWWTLSRFFDVLGGFEFVFALPGFSIPFVHWLWRIPTLLASATVVSREVEDRTWNPLRTTTLSVPRIMFAKYSAIFRYMELHYTLVIAVRAVPVIILGVSWLASTMTVLPSQGFDYWFSTTVVFLAMGIYFLTSPIIDVAFDGALGMLASAFSERRSTALIMTMLARLSLWLFPLALTAPLQFGLLNNALGVAHIDVITLKAVAVVATFGPTYAFLWGVPQWPSVALIVVTVVARLGAARLMLAIATLRASRIEI